MPVQWPEWLIGLFGGALVWFGLRAILTREARVDAEFDDRREARAIGLGWLWVLLGWSPRFRPHRTPVARSNGPILHAARMTLALSRADHFVPPQRPCSLVTTEVCSPESIAWDVMDPPSGLPQASPPARSTG